MKRLVICCDGTWQSLDNECPTNVQQTAKFVKSVDDQQQTQIVYYDAGVGTRGVVDKLSGGALGHGLDIEIREAYRFLSLNYEPGDEIYLFGFSRGAYTVRSLAGLIYCSGIIRRALIGSIGTAIEFYRDPNIKPDHEQAILFRRNYSVHQRPEPPLVHFLGCWDTVGALGVPDAVPFLPIDDMLGRKYAFHDTDLGSHILHARHAVALDERRKVFDVTPMNAPSNPPDGHTRKQVWFPGTHGGVGGGEWENKKLADCPLLWMLNEANAVGLAVDFEELDVFVDHDPNIEFDDKLNIRHHITLQEAWRDGPGRIEDVGDCTITRWKTYTGKGSPYRPPSLKNVEAELDALDWPRDHADR